jgi:hypothetical protein
MYIHAFVDQIEVFDYDLVGSTEVIGVADPLEITRDLLMAKKKVHPSL